MPAAMTSRDSVSSAIGEQGKAIWFSTREETLGKFDLTENSGWTLAYLIVYCNGRPYVLRDASHPFQTLALSDRATNLEDIERRLKLDILEEARRYNGMILTHDEVKDGVLVPTWMSVDEASIRTPREVYDDIKREGWRVDYWRIPIAPDTPIEVSRRISPAEEHADDVQDNYLDAYVSVLRSVDPQTTSLVFNCGMGVVRSEPYCLVVKMEADF